MRRITEIVRDIDMSRANRQVFSTGLDNLDRSLDGGFFRKELVVLGAPTGSGKSYVAGQIMLTIARQGYRTAYFSLEISAEMIVSRLIGQIADLQASLISHGTLSPSAQVKKAHAVGVLKGYEAYMDFYDDLYQWGELKQALLKERYDFAVIDFIQNIDIPGMEEYPKLSFVTKAIQKTAKEINGTILLVSQLSNVIARMPGSDQTVEYRGSGAIGHAADLGFMLIRDHESNTAQLALKKSRRSVSFTKTDYLISPNGQYFYDFDKAGAYAHPLGSLQRPR